MDLKVKNFDSLLGIDGLSDALLNNHFMLYEGYVNNVNKVFGILAELKKTDQPSGPQFAELKRRAGWELNGVRLHELYFENLIKGGAEIRKSSALYKKIVQDFGSFEKWQKDFISTASMRGIGWVVLYFDGGFDKLINMWISEHDGGHLAGAKPLLVIDVFEHAYMLDYGTKKPAYLEKIMPQINWQMAEERFKK